mmetsp:Transcript_17960/g.28371  ORF Transcript_17960/g.28371 Transcript_17960/m.28371 type:complete len:1182 (+) Transcript_17960:107-3652(+)|eukprot:CAMPEP_0202688498 /NCGR_PEP_ID=MMETSP1385-20130828/3997_1 /ASSEMBLY_ACC=CAM_ASM_000861 /TAXON_ID=933848 /ORGANISM="Elphidium margaritaceum" /LENGTH=1181 /DNA_ID=CAMNT_0049343489 /DNA_START=103 /DNA_END=3648 /DNA_ORIENTATION=-
MASDPALDPEVTADTIVDTVDSTTATASSTTDGQASKPNADLNLPDDPLETTVQQQRTLMKRLGERMTKTGEQWFPIDKKWYDSWKTYTMWDKGDDDIPGGLEDLDKCGLPRPGKIDNSDLADPNNEEALKLDIQEGRTHVWIHEDQWSLLYSWYGGGPSFPRKVYERGGTYTKEKYICIYPQLVKLVYADEESGAFDVDKKDTVETKQFPPDYTLKEVAAELESEIAWKKEEDSKRVGSAPDTPYVHVWLEFSRMKEIYTVDKAVKVTVEMLEPVMDGSSWVEIPDDYLKTKLDEIMETQKPQSAAPAAVTSGADAGAAAADDNTAAETTTTTTTTTSAADADGDAETTKKDVVKQFFVGIERKRKDGKWPRAKGDDWRETITTGDILDCEDMQKKWYEALVRYVYPSDDAQYAGKFVVHYIGWNIKWDERVDVSDSLRVLKRHTKTSGPHRPRRREYGGGGGGGYYESSFSFYQNENGAPEQRGVVGLRNLGNTCFMSSCIQCLAQAPQLTNYFLNGEYQHHINVDNPLGWGGKVAKAWAALLKDIFSGQYRVIAPRDFKNAIGGVAPRFLGYAQQDSQEFLSFALDGLHEDLNQIKKKPATEGVESAGRPDTVVALESWKTYLRRNQSIIVDLFQGQYKSTVVCPDCPRISITFDPYMFLSVPLPTEKYKMIEYTWIAANTAKPPTVFGQKMLKVADIGMLKESVAKTHGVSKEELFVCDIWKSKIHRELRRHDSVADINRKSDDIFIYHSPRPDIEAWKAKYNIKDEEEEEQGDKDKDKEKAADATEDGGGGDADNERERGGAGAGTGAGAGVVARAAEEDGVTGTSTNYSSYNYNRGAGGRGAPPPKPQFQTFVVHNQHQVVARQNFMGGQPRYEDEQLGYPLLTTLPNRIPVTFKQIRQSLWSLIQPFVHDENLTLDDELPFEFFAAWGFDKFVKIADSDQVFEFQRNLKFVVQWRDPKQYKANLYDATQRVRDESAPAPMDNTNTSAYDDDDRRGRGKPIELSACLEAFCETETLNENDAWYCSSCKDFKCATKKIDLWSTPDLLTIHLKRFSYTRNWRDRINTLVRFPIDGLDLSPFLKSDDHQKDAIYDLFGISNHMGGMGGGHYTSYAKNMDNHQWYYLDDSRTSKVVNLEGMVSSSAYVLYYRKRNPRQMKQRASRIDIDAIERAHESTK